MSGWMGKRVNLARRARLSGEASVAPQTRRGTLRGSERRPDQAGTGAALRRLRWQGRSGWIGWPARLALAGAGRPIQFLYNMDLTVEDYVKRKAWWDASAPA